MFIVYGQRDPLWYIKHHTKRLLYNNNMVKKYCVSPVGKNTRHSRDSMNTLCLERQRTRTCVCAREQQPLRVYWSRAAAAATACHKGLFPDRIHTACRVYVRTCVRARAQKRGEERVNARENSRLCLCIYIYNAYIYMRSQIMTTFTALRPIRERPTRTFSSLFRRCV